MTAQPLRVGGLAFVCALATATLVLVAMLASQLVLSAVAAVGLVGPAAQPAEPATLQGTLVFATPDEPECDRRPRAERGACADQRRSVGSARP